MQSYVKGCEEQFANIIAPAICDFLKREKDVEISVEELCSSLEIEMPKGGFNAMSVLKNLAFSGKASLADKKKKEEEEEIEGTCGNVLFRANPARVCGKKAIRENKHGLLLCKTCSSKKDIDAKSHFKKCKEFVSNENTEDAQEEEVKHIQAAKAFLNGEKVGIVSDFFVVSTEGVVLGVIKEEHRPEISKTLTRVNAIKKKIATLGDDEIQINEEKQKLKDIKTTELEDEMIRKPNKAEITQIQCLGGLKYEKKKKEKSSEEDVEKEVEKKFKKQKDSSSKEEKSEEIEEEDEPKKKKKSKKDRKNE